MVDRLKDKVAIVTGGSTGIGEGIGKVFISEGAKVVLAARNEELLTKVANEIGGKNILTVKCDVSKTEDVKNLIQKTVNEFGKINILVNNAGKLPKRKSTIEDATEEEWEEFQGINAKGTFLCSKYAIPYIRKAGGGSIIMISAVGAHLGQKNTGPYNSSKAAQEGLVKSMAVDFAGDKIRVNAICPAWIMIDSERAYRESNMDYIASMHPMGRIGTPEDIAWAAVYLASDESTWVTGATFMIDGGYSAT